MARRNSGKNRQTPASRWLCVFGAWPAILILLACGPSHEPISEYLPAGTSIAKLKEVELGMSFRELRSVRPGVTPHPYVGASEVLEGYTIYYHFDKTPQEAAVGRPPKVPARARLISVSETSAYPSTASAESRWKELIRQLRERGRRVECHSKKPSETTLLNATVYFESVRIGILLYPQHTLGDVTGVHHFPARIIASVYRREAKKNPFERYSPISCPGSNLPADSVTHKTMQPD